MYILLHIWGHVVQGHECHCCHRSERRACSRNLFAHRGAPGMRDLLIQMRRWALSRALFEVLSHSISVPASSSATESASFYRKFAVSPKSCDMLDCTRFDLKMNQTQFSLACTRTHSVFQQMDLQNDQAIIAHKTTNACQYGFQAKSKISHLC